MKCCSLMFCSKTHKNIRVIAIKIILYYVRIILYVRDVCTWIGKKYNTIIYTYTPHQPAYTYNHHVLVYLLSIHPSRGIASRTTVNYQISAKPKWIIYHYKVIEKDPTVPRGAKRSLIIIKTTTQSCHNFLSKRY